MEKTGLMSSVLADGDAGTNAQKDIYVSPSGDDTSTGESTSSQLKTINASLSKINASDIATVHLAKGIYADDGDNMINIDFAHAVYGGSLTFTGDGYNETFIDGSSIKKIFTIGADSIVSFKNISFINAKDQYGAITNNGKLSLENCIFEDNVATTYGGAVYTPSNFGNATLDVKNSVFKNCSSSYSGGAVYTYGSSSFENCQFIDCKGATGSWYYGGAIYEDCYAAVKYLNVLNCEFVNCSAGQGGVIYLRGYQGNVTGTVKNNRFTDCSASSNYDIAYLLVAHMDWTNNTIEGSSSSSAPICSYDGNIFKNTVLTFINEETINIYEPSISLTATLTDDMGNRITGGKVVFFFNDTQITAGGYNEGTIAANGEASISVTKLLDDGTYTVTGYYNGADNDTATVKNGTAVVSIERTPVDLWISTDGDDDTGNGSEGNPFKTLKKAVNTGFESTISVIVHVKEGTYSGTGNTAVSFSDLGFITIVGDGEDNPVFDGLGTASSMITFGKYTSANVIGITFVNLAKSTSTWSSNTAIKNSASDTTIAFTDCVFQNMNDGLSVYNATIENCKFINATAVVTNSNMEECEFVNCTKTALNLGTSNITNSVFRDNTGGAITARHNVAMHTGISYTITNCIFENNHAVNGSAISFPTGSMTSGERFAVISDNTFINNTADEIGGAVYLDPSMNMTFKNNRFENNSAKYGGAIAFGIPGATNMLNIAGVHIDFINNTLVGNTATDEADAIYGISGRFNAVVVFDNLTTTKLSDDFHATVSDDMGNPVSGGTIRYYLGGVFVGTSDVVNGSSVFHYVGFVDGVYNLTGFYSLQDNDTVSISPAIVNVSIAQSLPSVTLYVGPEGDDENGNGSEANPFKTIEHAYEVGSGLSTNIIIELLEGNITGVGNTHIELSGTVNITINGKGINKTYIDASNLTKKAEFSILINPGGQFFTLSNLTFANGVAKYNQSNQSNWDNNIILSEGNHMYVDHVCFTKNNGNGGGCISNYGTLIVVDSDFFNNGDTLNASTIDNYGYLEINNTSFILNHAKYGTLYNHPAGTMYISNCYFEDDIRTGYMSYFSRIRNEGYASVNDTTFIVTGRNQTEILDIIGYGNMGFGSNNANDRDNPLITIGFYNNKTMIFDNITYIAHTAGVKFNGAKNNQQVWGTNGIPLYFAGNCTVINSRFENIPVLYISNAGFKGYDAETDTNVSYGGLTIENCSFENLGGITVSAAQPSTKIVNHFLLQDNLILFNKSTAQPFNVTWANNAEGELTFVNNWFGNNDPTYYNATSKTFNNCSSWLYLTIDETVAGDLSQGLKLLFKSASVEEVTDEETNVTTNVLVLRDYDGSMYAREFLFESEDGTINPESGEISNSVDAVFSGDGLGNKTLKVTVDDAVVEYTVTLFKGSVINVQCDDITYGENATVAVTLTDVDGNIIEETVYMSVVDVEDFELHDGNDSVVLEGYEGGVYIILFQFNGTETYLPSNTIFELVVSPRETVLDAEDISVEIGSGSLNISLSSGGIPLGQKIIEITVNDDSSINASTDENGIVALDLSTYDLGSYDVKAFYAGDNNYTNSTASARVTVTKVLRTVEDLQELINNASAGDTVDLGDYEYRGVSNVNITKDIVLVGNGTIISTAGDKNPVFVIAKDVSSVSISDIEFKANNGDVLVKATATNATSNIAIETPKIEISNNTVVKANDKVVPESIKVLELDSERSILASNNEIKVSDNTLESGVNPFEFRVTSLATEEGIVVPSGGNIPEKLETVIILENMTTFAYQSSVDGDIGDYFYATLQDVNGNPLANKTVKVGLNGKVYTRTTNETGGIGVLMKTAISGRYTFAVSFLGDDNYNASFAVALCTVNKQTPKLSTSSKSYKASAKTKTLSATLKTKAGNPLKGKTLKFTVNGKTYSATTNSKGVASVKVSLSKKGSYSFTVKYAGDSTYASVSKKATLKLT